MMDQRDKRIDEFVELFNSKRFFEAHEVLEDLWIETEGDIKDYYKGLIQCAVAFVHLERGNYRGAKKLFRTACGYLNRYPSPLEGIDVEKLLKEFQTFFETIVPEAEELGITLDLENINTPRM
jgi:predicted metal-dependent hydrolase